MPVMSMVLLALDAFCIIHAAKTGRFWPWAWVVLFLPGIGAAAYVVMEFIPEWRASVSGQRAAGNIQKKLDPDRRLRELRERFELSDTIGNRVELARECAAVGRFDEAVTLWDGVIAQPLGEEAKFHQERAAALLGAGRAAEALQALAELKRIWPDHQSQEGHLVLARSLASCGRIDEAVAEYRELTNYYVGPQPGLDLARLLRAQGRVAEAVSVAEDYIRRIERSPKFNREQYKAQLSELKALTRGK